MRRAIVAMMSVLFALALASCGGGGSQSSATASSEAAGQSADTKRTGDTQTTGDTQGTGDATAAGTASTTSGMTSASLSATVVYLDGDVSATRNGAIETLDIGSELLADDTISVGASSYCEIQFGDVAVARVNENTNVVLASLSPTSAAGGVEMALSVGSVVSKVRKLATTESYAVRTDGVTCGVRGTEFAVSTDVSGDTVLDVAEGAVAVLPPDVSLSQLETDAEAVGEEASAAVKQVAAALPVVEAGYQLTVPKAEAEQLAAHMSSVAESVRQAAALPQAQRAERVAAIRNQAASATATVRQVSAPKRALDPSGRERLKPAQSLELRPVETLPARPSGQQQSAASQSAARPSTPAAQSSAPAAESPVAAEPQAAAASQAAEPQPAAAPPVAAAPRTVPVTVTVIPPDANVQVDGRTVASGSSVDVAPGTRVTVVANRPGFRRSTLSYEVKSDGNDVSLRLEPQPLDRTISVSARPIVGETVGADGSIYAADDAGTVYAVSVDGSIRWRAETANAPNQSAAPVASPRFVFFSGTREFVVIDRNNGKVVRREELTGQTAHPFGERVAVSGDLVFFPQSDGLRIINANTGDVIKTIPVPGGVRMSPTFYRGTIYAASQRGEFIGITPGSGEVTMRVQTNALQPVGLSVSIINNRALFAGRRGTVAAINLNSGNLAWQIDLPEGARPFTDIVTTPDGAFVFTGDSIVALSISDGSQLFPPIEKITAPPAYIRGKIIAGDASGTLHVYDAATGRDLARFPLGGRVSAAPVFTEGRLVVPLEGGSLAVLFPEGLEGLAQARR